MVKHPKLKLRFSRSHSGRFRRMTSLSVGTAVAVILFFLAVTFAYTCPGLAFMHASGYSHSTTAHHIKANPCQGAKKDICQSVRDRMLSVRATSLQFLLTASPDLAGFSFFLAAPEFQSGQTFHPQRMLLLYLKASKPPFTLYTTVLRI